MLTVDHLRRNTKLSQALSRQSFTELRGLLGERKIMFAQADHHSDGTLRLLVVLPRGLVQMRTHAVNENDHYPMLELLIANARATRLELLTDAPYNAAHGVDGPINWAGLLHFEGMAAPISVGARAAGATNQGNRYIVGDRDGLAHAILSD